jgi:hypothetical protein
MDTWWTGTRASGITSSEASGAVLSCQSHFTILGTNKGLLKLLRVFVRIVFQHSPSWGEALFFPIDFPPTPITCITHDNALTFFMIDLMVHFSIKKEKLRKVNRNSMSGYECRMKYFLESQRIFIFCFSTLSP